MKRTIINTLCGVLLGAMLLLGGCNEPEEVITPNFPEKISVNVAAGEQFEFTITPNTVSYTHLTLPTMAVV